MFDLLRYKFWKEAWLKGEQKCQVKKLYITLSFIP